MFTIKLSTEISYSILIYGKKHRHLNGAFLLCIFKYIYQTHSSTQLTQRVDSNDRCLGVQLMSFSIKQPSKQAILNLKLIPWIQNPNLGSQQQLMQKAFIRVDILSAAAQEQQLKSFYQKPHSQCDDGDSTLTAASGGYRSLKSHCTYALKNISMNSCSSQVVKWNRWPQRALSKIKHSIMYIMKIFDIHSSHVEKRKNNLI